MYYMTVKSLILLNIILLYLILIFYKKNKSEKRMFESFWKNRKVLKFSKNNKYFFETAINNIRDNVSEKNKEGFKNVELAKESIKKNIKFIHITKTGGTSIENMGKKNNYSWGRFDAKHLKKYKTSLSDKDFGHIPLKYFEENPYKNNTLFTVVRNPYTRCISEFYCPYIGFKNKEFTIEDFNSWIRDNINKVMNNYYCKDGHFIPHFEYFKYNEKDIIDYVIYFEDIKRQFNILFEKEKIELDTHSNKAEKLKKYGVEDLDNETIKLINKFYHKDFILFNYKMINP